MLTVTIPVSPKSQPRKIQVATGQNQDSVVLENGQQEQKTESSEDSES